MIVLGSLLLSSTREIHSPDCEGFTPLHYAAYFGQEGSLVAAASALVKPLDVLYSQELLLQAEPGQVSDPNISSFSPLHCALVSGNEQCGHLLLSHSASVSCQDSQGFTVLHIAAATNLLNSTNLLLAKGAEVNARDFRQRTPLMLAAGRGHVNMLEVLMAAKADCELEDGDSNTALHLACRAGMSRSANLLLRDVSSDLVSRQNSLGKSALHLAAGKVRKYFLNLSFGQNLLI